jgi:hypothetical protein
MIYLLGIDEAGYGPNLGPLVVSASVWRLEKAIEPRTLYDRLADCITNQVPRAGEIEQRLVVADSKVLYSPAVGLGRLERSVLAALTILNKQPADWRELWLALEACPADHAHRQLPWHCDYERSLPVAADPTDIAQVAHSLSTGLPAAGVQLVALRSRTVFPAEFNRLVAELGNKGAALSHVSLQLAAALLDEFSDARAQIICDKHGGRNRYGPLLQPLFPDTLVEVARESPRESLYRWGPKERRMEMRFCVGAECYLPVALASLASKYLREVCMGAFNDFWLRLLPGLRPTAGYPTDAGRFRKEIQAVQAAAGVQDDLLWRSR